MGERPQLSLVVAVYDEAENLESLHGAIHNALDAVPWSWEVLYVDDGSTDGSDEILRRLARKDPRTRMVRFRENSGQTAAWQAGFRAARGDWIATLDADLQNDPADLPRMVRLLDDPDHPADVVCGIRAGRRDNWWRRFQSRIGNGVRNLLTGRTVQDVGCSLRVMRREFLEPIQLFDGLHRFLPTLLHWEGARIVETEVAHHPRAAGRSKYGLRNRAWRGLQDLLAVRWMRARRIRAHVVERVD